MRQDVVTEIAKFEENIDNWGVSRLLIVCGASYDRQSIKAELDRFFGEKSIEIVYFRGFTPNPKQEEVEAGIQFFRENECEGIIAIGGGSAIDVAKCIKLNITDDINFAAIPTTAGSGSEATRFAVIYENGEKKSIQDESILPECVLLDASTLENLPEYQRKATFLDAYCHAVESYWSRNSTEESKKYAVTAIELLTGYIDEYMQGNKEAAEKILNASYQAGRAINISKTTAGHAMCYKLTTLYGLAHGHAAALCVINCWKFMQKSSALDVLEELEPALKKLEIIYDKFNLKTPQINDEKERLFIRMCGIENRLKAI